MSRKEEILKATLGLASEYGLRSVSLAQIADRVGMRKPSLYNHFSSKDDIMQAAYQYLREQAQSHAAPPSMGTDVFAGKDLEEVLLNLFDQYCAFVLDEDLLRFFRVLYAERSTSPAAAQIMVDETDRMVQSVKALFYALSVHGMVTCDDVDQAALSYAMTIHSLVDYQMDKLMAAGEAPPEDRSTLFAEARGYISWFARQMEVPHA